MVTGAGRPPRFTDKVALVTGGAAGIGAAVGRLLAAEGATVVAADLSGGRADDLAAATPGVVGAALDVTDSAAVDALVDRIVAAHGRLDVLVNSAGSDTRDDPQVTVALTDEQWRRTLSSHLDGTFFCTRAALRPMARQGAGVIVNIASMWGIAGVPGQPHYSAAKGGVLGLTRSVAKEVIAQGIRVNAIAPGWVETPRLTALRDEVRRQKTAQAPIGRFADADEIARAVLFLVSDDASYLVGATLSANGGVVTA